MKRTTIELDDAVHRSLRVESARIGTPLTKIVSDLIKDWLKRRQAQSK